MTKEQPKAEPLQNSAIEQVALLTGLAILVVLPLLAGGSDYVLQVFTHALLLATLALAWNILAVSGSISLGHAAFFGVGAYTSGLISLELGVSSWITIPTAGLLAVAVAVLMWLFCHRLRGAYFALATLAFVEIPRVVTDNWDGLTRGSRGLVGLPGLPGLPLGSHYFDISTSPTGSYYFVLVYGLVLLALTTFIFRSNVGLAFQAIREEETAAETLGIQVQSYRLLALLLSALFTGITGGLYAHLVRYIEPGMVYGLRFSAIPMIFAICGGRFTIIGPALAALVLYPLDQFLFHPLLPAGHEFLYGAVIILTILFLPSGFWGHLRKGQLVSIKTGSIE
jgi:branched-chain amino acid transport system permease protein